MAQDSYSYQQPFQFSEIELKGEKRYFVEGFISTSDPDLSNEVITREGLADMVQQCNERAITMDVEHEEWYEGGQVQNKPANARIPVAKIIKAELRNNGVWVKAEINRNSDRFKNIWGSVQEGFLHSFSVAFYPLRAVTKKVGNQVLKFIDSLSLVNVTLTGSPVNPNATFTPVMKAAMNAMPAIGENTMEENKVEAPVAEIKAAPVVAEVAPVVAEIKSDSFEAVRKDLESMKKDLEAMKKSLEEKKEDKAEESGEAKDENKVPAVEEKALDVHGGQNPHVKADAEMVSSIKALQEEVAELKAKLAEPVIKGIGPQTKVEDLTKQAQIDTAKSVLDYI
jgi:hypothetical protein